MYGAAANRHHARPDSKPLTRQLAVRRYRESRSSWMRGFRKHSFLLALAALLIFLLAACVKPERSAAKVLAPGSYAVDPLFSQFYTSMGGQDLFGSAISLRFSHNAVECQYLQNALMCYDPAQPDMARFTVYPLGLTFQVRDEPDAASAPADAAVV